MSFIRNLLNEQRRRMVGSLMTHIEQRVYPHLPESERKELRSRVLAAVGQYHDTCLDMLKASVVDDTVVNQEAVETLARMDRNLAAMRREAVDG